MRNFLLAAGLAVCGSGCAQTVPASPSQTRVDLRHALVGDWVGVLEYRDYSEPATSNKRVQLPTWLTIAPAGDSVTEHFTYDDGPTKTVEETETVSFDVAAATYTEIETGKPAQVFTVAGYEKLKSGRGEIVLTGATLDNDKPAETRITLTLRRNLVSWIEEVRAAHSTEPFVFRHRFTFTRSTPPKIVYP
jgi:hypothetical protein